MKLKEFELFNALRRSIVGVERDGDHVLGRERFSTRVGVGAATTAAAPLVQHPPARLHGALGRRPAGRPIRPDLRHLGLHGDGLAAAPLWRPRAGPLFPDDVPLPAQGEPARLPAQGQAREVPRRRRLLLEPRVASPAHPGDADPARLPRGARQGFPVLERPAHRAQPRPVPAAADPDRRQGGGRRPLRVLRPRRGRAHPSDLGQGVARDRRDQDSADHAGLSGGGGQPLLRSDDPPESGRGEQDRGVARLLLVHQPQRLAGERGHRRDARLHPAPGEGIGRQPASSACSTANGPTSRSRSTRRAGASWSASASSASLTSRVSTGCRSSRSSTPRSGATTPWSSCAAA